MKYLILFLLIGSSIAHAAQDLPPNWPWRGIAMDGNSHEIDIVKLAKLHVNAVELVLSIRNEAQYGSMTPDEAWNTVIMWADSMLDTCKQYGVVGIVTFSDMLVDPALPRADSPDFWENPKRLEESLHLVGKLAKHFSARGKELGAYEILSEPLVRKPPDIQETPSQWPGFRAQIIKEIRKYDSDRFIILSSGFGGETSSYNGFKPLGFSRVIYGAHVYNPHPYTHQGLYGIPRGMAYPNAVYNKKYLENVLRPLVAFQEKYHKLVFIGEFSAVRWSPGGNQYLYDLIDLFDRHKFSWMYFSYNGFQGWDPSYDEKYDAPGESPRPQAWIGFGSKRWGILKKAYERNAK